MMDYIKIYTDMEEFFVGEDIPDEVTGKLLKACFNYAKTGDAHIEELFEPGSAGRMAWKAIRRHLEACAQKAEANAQNRTGKTTARKKEEPARQDHVQISMDDPEAVQDAHRTPSSEIKNNEPERKITNRNESERTVTTPYVQKQEHTHTHAHTQTQKETKTYQEQQLSTHGGSAAPAAGWYGALAQAKELRLVDNQETLESFQAGCIDAAAECTPEWIMAAMEQCRRNHSMSWAYFAAILRGYQRSGGIDTRTGGSMSGSSSRKLADADYEQRPNDLPDGNAVPMWLADHMQSA